MGVTVVLKSMSLLLVLVVTKYLWWGPGDGSGGGDVLCSRLGLVHSVHGDGQNRRVL